MSRDGPLWGAPTEAAMLPPSRRLRGELAPGAIVDRYTVEAVLGRGGMAVVYRVRHNRLGSLHALKVLVLPSGRLEARMLREGRLQSGLRHPNVLPVTDVVDVGGAAGLVMTHVAGPSLAALLARTRLTLAQVRGLAPPILRGVAAAHKRGLVHRDLKPGNILLQPEDDARRPLSPLIADFGLARLLEASGADGGLATRTGELMGTPAYAAPEQIRDAARADARADVFALGVVLYEMLAGVRPFRGQNPLEVIAAIDAGRFEPPIRRAPTLPEPVNALVCAALRHDPDARPADAGALLAAWLEAAGDAPAEPIPDDVWRPLIDAAPAPRVPGGGARRLAGGRALRAQRPPAAANHVRARRTLSPGALARRPLVGVHRRPAHLSAPRGGRRRPAADRGSRRGGSGPRLVARWGADRLLRGR